MLLLAILFGTIGFISLLLQTGIFILKLHKIKNWIKVEGTVIRIDEKEWSGDIDREPGVIYTSIIEFKAVETNQNWNFSLPDYPHYYFLKKVGAKTTLAYPPNEPKKVIVFDRKYLITDFVKSTFIAILLLLISLGLYIYLKN